MSERGYGEIFALLLRLRYRRCFHVILAAYIFGGADVGTVGSSGAVYGLLVAYAVVFPDQTILFGFLIPMKSKFFVMIIGAIVFLNAYMATVGGQRGSGVAVTAHLGGMVAGYLWLRGRKLHWQVRDPLVSGYKDWKLRRAKKKFEPTDIDRAMQNANVGTKLSQTMYDDLYVDGVYRTTYATRPEDINPYGGVSNLDFAIGNLPAGHA